MTKKWLLSGVAALLMATSAASTPKVELPDSMVGPWCYVKEKSTDTERHYLELPNDKNFCSCPDRNDCVDEDLIRVDKDGYVSNWVEPGFRHFCTFEKIEVIKNAYLAHASCWSGWGKDIEPPWTENLELRVIEGELVITELPEG